MRHRKWLALVLACAMCFGLFAGCKETHKPQGATTVPPVTQAPTTEPATEPTTEPTTAPTEPPLDAQMLMENLRTGASAEPTAMEMQIELEAVLDIPGYGISMSFIMEVSGVQQNDYGQDLSYSDMNMKMIAMGQKETTRKEIYRINLDGQQIEYEFDHETEKWTKNVEAEEDQPEREPETMELLEELTEYEGEECYVLRLEFGSETVQEILSLDSESFMDIYSMFEQSGLDSDMSALRLMADLYFEKESLLLWGVEAKVYGMEFLFEGVASVLEQQMGALVEMESSALSIRATQITYEPVEVPQISEKDKFSANVNSIDVTSGKIEVQPENGLCILKERQTSFQIQLPDGWTVNALSEVALYALAGDGKTEAGAVLLTDNQATMQDILDVFRESVGSSVDMEISVTQGELIQGYETGYCTVEDTCFGFAKIPGEGGYLFVMVFSQDGSDPEPYLQELIACVGAEAGA